MTAKKKTKPDEYIEGIGRRKTSTARVRIYTTRPEDSAEAGGFLVNDAPHTNYFSVPQHVQEVEAPLDILNVANRFRVSVHVRGGGIHGQAEAIRHGLARALLDYDEHFRKKLKRAGFLTRDPRMKERRKYGLKKARRAPQWSKR